MSACRDVTAHGAAIARGEISAAWGSGERVALGNPERLCGSSIEAPAPSASRHSPAPGLLGHDSQAEPELRHADLGRL